MSGGMITQSEAEHFRRQISERRRLMYLEGLIPLLQKKLREMKGNAFGSLRVTQSWAFMPRGTAVPDPTAAAAVQAAEAEHQAEYRQTQERLRALILERERLRAHQELFTCCLRALPEQHRFLVEAKLMEDRPWREVETLYAARYGSSPHRDTLRRHLHQAVQTMEEIENS